MRKTSSRATTKRFVAVIIATSLSLLGYAVLIGNSEMVAALANPVCILVGGAITAYTATGTADYHVAAKAGLVEKDGAEG